MLHDHANNGAAPISVDAFDFDFAVNTWEHYHGEGGESRGASGGNGNGNGGAGVTVLQLAIRYNVEGREYWDSNSGANYSLVLRN